MAMLPVMTTKPAYYTIACRSPAVADIRIDGPVGDYRLEESVTARQFVTDLNQIRADAINVYINSPGGSVMDANVIYSALQRHPAKINVVVDGWALSAASMIAMAGDTISMGQRSMLMLHNPHTTVAGNAAELRKTADVLDKVKSGMLDAYRQRMKGTADEISTILDAETWFSADEAVAAGLADGIVEDLRSPSPVPAALCAQISIPSAFSAFALSDADSNPIEDDPLSTELLESELAALQQANATLQEQLAAEKAAREAAESTLAEAQAAAKLNQVKALFAQLHREWSDEAAAPFLALPEAALTLLAAELMALQPPALDPALTQQVATAGAAQPDLLKLNAQLLAQVAGKVK